MPRTALDVARRCLVLELLAQRSVLEVDAEVPVADRERARASWVGRETDLGVKDAIEPDERAWLDRAVGTLSDDDLDDVHGRGLGAVVLLWALGRVESRPTLASVEDVLADHGLLGDGSVAKARAAAEAAALRSEAELDEALSAYAKTRGKAKEVDDPERIFACVAAHHLTWVLDPSMSFDDDVEV